MQVKDHIMYHYHNKEAYSDIWQEGNELIVDDNFNSNFCQFLNRYSTAVRVKGTDHETFQSFDNVLERYLNEDEFKKISPELAKKMLEESIRIIRNANLCHREYLLEKYRLEHYPELPSRYHSIWLTSYDNLEYWKDRLKRGDSLKLFKVQVTGNLFKSSDLFIPDDHFTLEEMYNQAEKYWNPNFEQEHSLEQVEYLFQGKVKILERIDFNN